jgi:hypothetical protein
MNSIFRIFGAAITAVIFVMSHNPLLGAAAPPMIYQGPHLLTFINNPLQPILVRHGQGVNIPTLPPVGGVLAVPAIPYPDHFTQIQIEQNVFIYFPANGRQPTLQKAVAWSCAKTNNDNITKWYKKMFGWVDPNQQQLSMGFNTTGANVPIITFAPEVTPTQQADFWDIFTELAKKSGGPYPFVSIANRD